MTSRWSVLLALVAVAGIALAGAATVDPTPSVPPGPTVVAGAVAQPEAGTADPYLETTPFSTEAPEPMVGCQVYAYTCKFEGGPCGPVPNTCHCAFDPGTGWLCAR